MNETSNAQHEHHLLPRSGLEAPGSLQAEEDAINSHDEESRETNGDTQPIEEGLSLLSLDEESAATRKPEAQFEPSQCLFCKSRSEDLDANLEHMLKAHGLSIPDQDHLIVDAESLIKYLHLVIFGYHECLYCGSQRSNVQAAQQHMTGKGHCKIDILDEASEFRDFYDFDSDSGDGDGEGAVSKPAPLNATFVEVDKSMRLASGKILSHRTQGKMRVPRHGALGAENTGASSISQSRSPSLDGSHDEAGSTLDQGAPSQSKRVAKREAIFTNQLATMRDSDRRSLMHLPVAEQRAIVMRGKRLVEQARKDRNEMLLKIQLKANRTAKK